MLEMLEFALGILAKCSIDVFFAVLLAVAFNWKGAKTSDLVLMLTNGVSLVSLCLTTVVRPIMIVLQSIGQNFTPIAVFSILSYATHVKGEEILEIFDAAYRNYYFVVYRGIIESYGWLLRVLYETFIPLFNLSILTTKKFLFKDVANSFATCDDRAEGIALFINVAKDLVQGLGEIMNGFFVWLQDITSNKLDVTAGLAIMQAIPTQLVTTMQCSCTPLVRPFSAVARLLSTKTFVLLADSAVNMPIRFAQMLMSGSDYSYRLNTFFAVAMEFVENLGIYMDDIVEEIVGVVTSSGTVNVRRPFVFGLLSYLGTAGVQVGQLAATTMVSVAKNPLEVPQLDIEPVFAQLDRFATSSGEPVQTIVDFAYGFTSKDRRTTATYCPLFSYNTDDFNTVRQSCTCQANCGSYGQCYNLVLCVPYYEHVGTTLHALPGQTHTAIIKKCNDDAFCNGGRCEDGRCFCSTENNLTISLITGKCEEATNAIRYESAVEAAKQNATVCNSTTPIDAPVGNPFACTVSSAMQAAVGGAYVGAAFARDVVREPALVGNFLLLLDKLNTYQGGISYRTDLSCEFRSRTNTNCNCSTSAFCGQPTLTHNVAWPLRKMAFYLGLGATESFPEVQDWIGAAITTSLTMVIDGTQAVFFVAVNLFDGFGNLKNNEFRKPFDLVTQGKPELCTNTEYRKENLCETNSNCIAWWYDGQNKAIRDLFYQEQEHWCGSLVVEPVIMRGEQLVKSLTNFVERLSSGSFRQAACETPQKFQTDEYMYINMLFNNEGKQLPVPGWSLFDQSRSPWCTTEWHPRRFPCDLSQSITEATELYSNAVRQVWRNVFAVLFFREPAHLDIDVHNRICDAHAISNSLSGLAGNTIGLVGGSRVGSQVAYVTSIGTELLYGPLITGSLFVADRVQSLVSVRSAENVAEMLDNTVINTIVIAARYVFVTSVKVIQILQVVAFNSVRRGSAGGFVRSMYTIIETFANFFNKHGVEVMRVLMQVTAGFFQILQGQGIGQFIEGFEKLLEYIANVIAEVFSSFWPWFKDVLGPVGDMLDFVEGTLCNAITAVGSAIKSVKDMIKPATGIFGDLGITKLAKSVGNFVSPVIKPLQGIVDKLPFGVGTIAQSVVLKKVGLGRIPIMTFMGGNVDSVIDKVANLNCKFSEGRTTGSRYEQATTPPPETASQRGDSILLHRRRRSSRRLLEEDETEEDVHRLFMEMQSRFDWSGTTVCAKIGQVQTPPQTPYEIAMWTSCVEYRIRAAAISNVIEVPSYIFDDWYSIAEWGTLLITGGLHYWTTNTTIEQLNHAGYPGNAIMQLHRGASAAYDGFAATFSIDEAIDRTFQHTETDTTSLKNIVHDLPSVTLPSAADTRLFAEQVGTGLHTAITTIQDATAAEPEQQPLPRRRLLLREETFGTPGPTGSPVPTPINIPRGSSILSFNLTEECPLIMNTLKNIFDVGLRTKDHYIAGTDTYGLRQTIDEFYSVVRNQKMDDDPLLTQSTAPTPNTEFDFVIPPLTPSSLIDSKANDIEEADLNWQRISPQEGFRAIKDFLTGYRRNDSEEEIPLLKKPLWDWFRQLNVPCDETGSLYKACKQPRASMKHTRRALARAATLMVGTAYVVPSPVSAAMLFASPTVLSYVFLHTRYGWSPLCVPMLPVCAVRDIQILLLDTVSVNKCFCQTKIGQALLKTEDKQKCENCVFYEKKPAPVAYASCERGGRNRKLPAPLWAPMRAFAWQFPRVFDFAFKSFYSPLRFVFSREMLADFPTTGEISAVDEACVYMHVWDIALLVTGLPMIASLAVFAYGQVVALTMQILLWFGTVLSVAKPSPQARPQPSAPLREEVKSDTSEFADVVLDVVNAKRLRKRR